MNIPNIEEIYAELLGDIKAGLDADSAASSGKPALIGIHSGGAWVAERLAADLGIDRVGFLSSAFHRDDFSQRGLPQAMKSTDIPFELNGSDIILVDDILYTGRTVRAALNEIFDYGRPASVELAVLLDRGGRELPIEPAYCGAYIALSTRQRFVLSRAGNAGDSRFTLTLEEDS